MTGISRDILFVFDKDGVLVDSEPIKLSLFERLFDAYPQHLSAICEYNRTHVGLARKDKLRHILGEILHVVNLEAQIDEYLDRAYHFIRDALIKAPPVPGVLEFIRRTPNRKFVCSAAVAEEVDDQLLSLSLMDAFEEVFTFPQMKADVLRRLKLQNNGRVVFWGDTILDMEAAEAAGVGFIGVDRNGHEAFRASGKVPTIRDFTDLDRLEYAIRTVTSCLVAES